MKINSGNANEEPRIELIPLIDVIFCILTFFLLAGLQAAKQQAISVDIPNASTGAPAARELLMVSLNDAGQIFLEQQPMLIPGQFIESVKQYRQARPNSSIVLYASKQVSYNKVVEVLDALRNIAGDRVALATLPSNTVAPTPPILTTPIYTNPANPANPSNPYQPLPNSAIDRLPAITPPSQSSGTMMPSSGDSNQPTQVNPAPVPQAIPFGTPIETPIPSKSPKP